MTNREEPIFRGTSALNSVNLGITTLCTMRCPNCSLGMPGLKTAGTAKHVLPETVWRDAVHMRGLKRVHLTGGEPTMHPDFAKIVVHTRTAFDCEYLTVETNGAYYRRYRDLFKAFFDKVFITHYVLNAIYPGNYDNTEVIKEAEQDLGDKLIREEPVRHERAHLPMVWDKPDSPCSKFYQPGLPCGWYDGLLYPCCVSFGIHAALGFPVTPDWREVIVSKRKGCHSCLYRGT